LGVIDTACLGAQLQHKSVVISAAKSDSFLEIIKLPKNLIPDIEWRVQAGYSYMTDSMAVTKVIGCIHIAIRLIA
jgi:hypothetical protein